MQLPQLQASSDCEERVCQGADTTGQIEQQRAVSNFMMSPLAGKSRELSPVPFSDGDAVDFPGFGEVKSWKVSRVHRRHRQI